jgi:hypothetical protein
MKIIKKNDLRHFSKRLEMMILNRPGVKARIRFEPVFLKIGSKRKSGS